MKFLDCHCHMMGKLVSLEYFLSRLDEAGVERAIVLSYPPASHLTEEPVREDARRLELVMDWAARSERIIPFYWIDPTQEDALEQVDRAVQAGVRGFKTICDHFYPCDERPMQVWRRAAEAGKPLLFHSGILYSVRPASNYNRPANFEALTQIPNLRFAMAHISWPWCDECLAVYGRWAYQKRKGMTTSEMFIDATPGTPPLYREEALTKLYRNPGFELEDNVMLGIDCEIDYSPAYAREIVQRDQAIFDRLSVAPGQREKYFSGNARRFLGE